MSAVHDIGAHSRPVVLSARGVTKVYPGTTALNQVDFEVWRGQVNVLIGENGAGKSTLMKILAGIERPTTGELTFEGGPFDVASPREAMALGIGIVHQELNLFPNLTVTQNLFVGRELRGAAGTVRAARQRQLAREVFERMGQAIDVDAPLADLSIGQQQIVEIARVLIADVRILILDEPTSSLSESEVAVLFRLIDELKQQGVAIVYISHRLEELIEIGDRFTVLRDGELIETGTRGHVDIPWLVERMVGTRVEGPYRDVPSDDRADPEATPVLTVDNLRLPNSVGGLLLDDVSFSVTSGEIVGFYGLMGAGRTELFETLIGLRRAAAGTVTIDGRTLDAGRRHSETAGGRSRTGAGGSPAPGTGSEPVGGEQHRARQSRIPMPGLRGLNFGAMRTDVSAWCANC